MPHPELLLRTRLKSALARAFGAEHQDTDPLLRRSDRAHYQVNVAMSLGKALKRPPREVAQALLAELDLKDLCSEVEVAGPGFINLTLRDEVLAQALSDMLAQADLGVPKAELPDVVVVDYASPNIAKEMHVGHLRSSIIGDTLCRVLEFRGHRVIRQNHIGDWGTPFGMLLEHLLDLKQEGAAELDPSQLGDFYRAARVKFDGEPGFADRARARVVSLQAGDTATLALWQQFVTGSKRYMAAVFERLGVRLVDADVRGEGFFNPKLPEIAADLEARGIAVVDDGALCVFPPGFVGREGEPLPLIVRKKDGGFGYGATDLAALRFRHEVLGGTRLLYVVGTTQQQHLAMVFEVAKMAGWLAPPVRAEHVGFGSVLGDDRKMLKSRSGENVKLIELLSFGRALTDVETTLEPHKLCGFLYGLASSFSSFFDACPVLKSEPAERASRLALCELTARTLATGLDLLGIEAPERM